MRPWHRCHSRYTGSKIPFNILPFCSLIQLLMSIKRRKSNSLSLSLFQALSETLTHVKHTATDLPRHLHTVDRIHTSAPTLLQALLTAIAVCCRLCYRLCCRWCSEKEASIENRFLHRLHPVSCNSCKLWATALPRRWLFLASLSYFSYFSQWPLKSAVSGSCHLRTIFFTNMSDAPPSLPEASTSSSLIRCLPLITPPPSHLLSLAQVLTPGFDAFTTRVNEYFCCKRFLVKNVVTRSPQKT